jgi:hypothetical protein
VKKGFFSGENCQLNKDYEMMKSIILGNEYFVGDNLDLNNPNLIRIEKSKKNRVG